MPKVSIITTVYNGEKHIIDTIDSVLKQEFDDFEMIITDDGSTDNTVSKINQVNDHRIKVFLQPHMGRQKALNFSISNSMGEYIAILDADDIALPERLDVQVDYLDRNPSVGLVGAGKRVAIDIKGNIIRWRDIGIYSNREIRKALSYTNPLFHSSVMYRRDLFNRINGYDEKLYCLEDWDFYIRISRYCDLINIPQLLSCKRLHDDRYFGSTNGVHQSKKGIRARSIIYFRSVKYLNASRINLLRAIKLYLRTIISF